MKVVVNGQSEAPITRGVLLATDQQVCTVGLSAEVTWGNLDMVSHYRYRQMMEAYCKALNTVWKC